MKQNWLLRFLIRQSKRQKRIVVAVIFLLLVVNTMLLVLTGGIPSAFAHTMYIPVLLAAVYFGAFGAIIVGILGGLLVGPFLTIPWFQTGTEAIGNSLYRLMYFVIIGAIVGALFSYLQQQLEKLKEAHTHDMKTGIPNVFYYYEYSLHHEEEVPLTSLSILILNYESLVVLIGYDAYYEVLTKLYEKLKTIFPENALIVLADQRKFWVELSTDDFSKHQQEYILKILENTISVKDIPLFIEFSIGASSTPGDGVTRFKQSDIACMKGIIYPQNCTMYEPLFEIEQQKFERLGKLPKAIKENELFLVYQPIVDYQDKKSLGVEALIRWDNEGTIVSPMDFIPFAEQTRIINQITDWVFERVISDYQLFKEVFPSITVSMNISQRNLYEKPLIEKMIKRFEEMNIKRDVLEVEITESTMMLNQAFAIELLDQLQTHGIQTVLDDFGTAYSSLIHLRDLPIHKVKIDRMFIDKMSHKEEAKMLVEVMIDLIHRMGMKVIGEGIEDSDTEKSLKALGCDYGQGYYYAKPMKLQDAIHWMKTYIVS